MSDRAGVQPPEVLDDDTDRDELRQRYYGLVQELRVLLPGVQVLMAFLLTVPFSTGFDRLDDTGQALYGVALVASALSVIAFVTPAAHHRVGERRRRSERVRIGIRMVRAGLSFLAVALLAALAVVTRFVFGGPQAWVIVGTVGGVLVFSWLVVPLRSRADD